MGSREIDELYMYDCLARECWMSGLEVIKLRIPIFIAWQDKKGYHEVTPPEYGLGT